MIRDEELRSSTDYSQGQTEAAHRILVELVNLFDEYKDELRIVGGVYALADLFANVKSLGIIREMKDKLAEKYASVNHAGPVDVAEFMEVAGEEAEFIRRDAFEQIQILIKEV